jgi:formylglycine-generating enzyme required for sulfatase activity/serine/threonine protein kinase
MASPLEASAERIGPYRIIRQIGRGGQASVYLAEDTRLHRQVALKVMDPGFTADSVAVERFRREAEITSRLDHPGICTVYETGESGTVLWIAMRYVDGVSLARRVATSKEKLLTPSATTFAVTPEPAAEVAPPGESPPSGETGPTRWNEITELLTIFENAARALHAAHEAGVIHRDVKPGNMMVTPTGEIVILDFGLAVDVGSDLPTLTRTGDLMGTKEYMSPEQIATRALKLDRRTDVYSLGVSLFECLTLKRPFDAPTREGLYQAILTKAPPDLRKLNSAISEDLQIVVATAIEKDRDRRYRTALDLAEELRRVRMHEPIVAKPVGPFVRLARWAQRNPGLATAIGGLFAVLAAGLVVSLVLLGQRDRALLSSEAALADYDRLGDSSRLEGLRVAADALWPCEPGKVPAMRSWVEDASQLGQRLEGHRVILDQLRAESRPESRFASHAAQFKHDTTAKLVADLGRFLDPDPVKGLVANVRARLAFAESVERESLGKHEARWADAIRSIRDPADCPKYGGLAIEPQLGLVPLWKNDQGLWEFAHLQTTAPGADPIPRRGQDGRIGVAEETGLVFVLVPGGTFAMGAVKPDDDTAATEPNVDPDAESGESPVTSVTLAPFFLSKYEMTQAQWVRLVGKNPSQYGPGAKSGGRVCDLRHPIEQVSWHECDLWIGRLGLALPTEAQWEYAARAGTTAPRWSGLEPKDLAKAANLADAFFKDNGGPSSLKYEPWSDGFGVHAPVGSLAPNPFGLHDVLGNVWEWCRDSWGGYGVEPRAGDGLRSPPASKARVLRGGAFNYDASNVRSAIRYNISPEFRYSNLGVRPARPILSDRRL